MRQAQVLAATAARLNSEAGSPAIPALYFFTDPERTPDPVATARRLPRGTAIVYRHFGASDRVRVARRLAPLCRARDLILLIGADVELARRCDADGVHWPERMLPDRRGEAFCFVIGAAHSAASIARINAARLDACVLSPVFPTLSSSARASLGLFRASQLARASAVPVIALGGVNDANARRLIGRGFAGVAAVDALAGV
jgi:thiamine-phosphate pyrophosphorylase